MTSKLPARIAFALGVLEIGLVLASWVLSVLLPDSGIRSMLGSEGVRWFLGGFAKMLSGTLLVWLMLGAIAWGCVMESGVLDIFRRRRALHYRERIARGFVVCLSLCYVALFVALAFMPNALLLSASGGLFPSPFSASLVPALSFGLCFISIAYGIVSGRFHTVDEIYQSLFAGIKTAAPLFLYYILLIQLYYSIVFVFM